MKKQATTYQFTITVKQAVKEAQYCIKLKRKTDCQLHATQYNEYHKVYRGWLIKGQLQQ